MNPSPIRAADLSNAPREVVLWIDTVHPDGMDPPPAPPAVPVLIREEECGVRVIMGTRDKDDLGHPDLFIERRRDGWAVFLHPRGGGDPCGCVEFHDGGAVHLRRDGGDLPVALIDP